MPAEVPGSESANLTDSYLRLAREHLDRMAANITDLAESNRSLTEPGDTEYTFKGMVGITSVVFFTTVDASITVVDGTSMKFSGRAWGPAVNRTEAIGGGTFGHLPPDTIAGHCTFEVHSVSVGPGMLQVTWIRGSQILGTFLGAGPGIGITLPSGGSGTWSLAS